MTILQSDVTTKEDKRAVNQKKTAELTYDGKPIENPVVLVNINKFYEQPIFMEMDDMEPQGYKTLTKEQKRERLKSNEHFSKMPAADFVENKDGICFFVVRNHLARKIADAYKKFDPDADDVSLNADGLADELCLLDPATSCIFGINSIIASDGNSYSQESFDTIVKNKTSGYFGQPLQDWFCFENKPVTALIAMLCERFPPLKELLQALNEPEQQSTENLANELYRLTTLFQHKQQTLKLKKSQLVKSASATGVFTLSLAMSVMHLAAMKYNEDWLFRSAADDDYSASQAFFVELAMFLISGGAELYYQIKDSNNEAEWPFSRVVRLYDEYQTISAEVNDLEAKVKEVEANLNQLSPSTVVTISETPAQDSSTASVSLANPTSYGRFWSTSNQTITQPLMDSSDAMEAGPSTPPPQASNTPQQVRFT